MPLNDPNDIQALLKNGNWLAPFWLPVQSGAQVAVPPPPKVYTTLDAYTMYQKKGDGVSKGGFYKDPTGDKWLIKEGHSNHSDSVVKEYIAGGLYQMFLGESAPQVEIIIDSQKSKLMIGSKLLDNFSTFKDYLMVQGDWWDADYGNTFPQNFNGKPLTGFEKAISTILLLGDVDAHCANTGYINAGDHFEFAKIDHGLSFNYQYSAGRVETLDDVRAHCKKFYAFNDLSKIGFDPLLDAIRSIADQDFSDIIKLVDDKATDAQKFMDAAGLKYVDINYFQQNNGMHGKTLDECKASILKGLSNNQNHFKDIADKMVLEKAIREHQVDKLIDLHEKGVMLDAPFKPFYDKGLKINNVHGQYTKSVDGLSLLKTHWAEAYEPLSQNYQAIKSHTIDIKDVLHVDMPTLDALFVPQPIVPIVLNVPDVAAPMPIGNPIMMHQDQQQQVAHADVV